MTTWREAVESFNEYLDTDGEVIIAGQEFTRSHLYRKADPIGYRCLLLDFIDSLDIDSDTLTDDGLHLVPA